jgi:ferredoxin
MTKIKINYKDNEIEVNQDKYISLLIAMENNKMPVEYGCLIGVCGACEMKVDEGMDNIEYFEEPMIEPEKGNIIPCCCKAKGDVKLTQFY